MLQTQTVFFDIGDTLVSGADGIWLPGAKNAVAGLLSVGYRVGLISNTGNLSRSEVERLVPDGFFDEFNEDELLILSSEVRAEKPGIEIYEIAIDHAAVVATACLYVGEKQTEVAGAQAAGMKALRICDAATDLPQIQQLLNPVN